MFMLIDPSGNVVVPNSAVVVTGNNKCTFRLRPSSGTATAGIFQGIWDIYVGQESHVYVDVVTVKERS